MVLIGIFVVIVGFALKLDSIAVIIISALTTGFAAHMDITEILSILGKTFVNQRLITIFILTLPIIGISERYGLKEKAVELIKNIKNLSTGKLLTLYCLIRQIAGAMSLRISGHPQFVRPLINPMAQGAAISKYGEIDKKYEDKITVGFTHLQHAQPITIGFVFMAYFQMFKRDIERLTDTLERLNYNPLGACALAGTTMPIDRHLTSELLSFTAPTENAMDTVSDRDYSLEFLSDASISMMHLSRWAEEFAWWNSSEFSYIAIDDSFCTGSSIMPQKKNPDMAELIRGKVGRVYGDLMQLLTVMKGTPLAYNKDFQEDKESLFDAIDTWKATIDIFAKMLDKTEFRMDQIEKQLGKGFLNATDIAEHFAKQGIPFREAHAIVGHMVKACEKKGCDLEDLTDEELQAIDKRVTKELLGDISIKSCVNARVSFGGTAPSEVHRQIEVGRQWLNSLER